MGFTIVALVLGVVVGVATGGRPGNIGLRPLRALGALGAAVVFQAVPQLIDVGGSTGLAFLLASYGLLVAFALANIRFVGMPVVLLGLVLNAAVIGANGGMPVRGAAILTVDRSRTPAALAEIRFGAKRHLETRSDRLTFLDDALPVRPLGQVLSFGDIVLAAGIADVVFRLLKPAAPIRRRRRPSGNGHLPRASHDRTRRNCLKDGKLSLTTGWNVPIGTVRTLTTELRARRRGRVGLPLPSEAKRCPAD